MMKNEKTPLVFFGNERLATGVSTNTPTLKLLIEAGYKIAAVVSSYEVGRSRNARELEIKELTELHNIPVLLPDKPSDIAEQLKGYEAPVAVLVAYGKIIPQSIIDIFPKGIINIHPSLLPMHRGPTPIESVILDGSETTGVSIMQLVRDMDAGPVFDQTLFRLNGSETKQQLADKLLEIGGKMLIELLPGILDGSKNAKPQNNAQATYDKLISKSSGVINWNKPAVIVEREIRAYSGWPKSQTKIGEIDCVITEAVASTANGKAGSIMVNEHQFGVYCSDGCLIIQKLTPAGKKEMTSTAFLAGYKTRLSL
jgi:methionyl-tRNA formyltransferase